MGGLVTFGGRGFFFLFFFSMCVIMGFGDGLERRGERGEIVDER